MTNDFNSVARYYDLLKKIVFGDLLLDAELSFLKDLKTPSRILMAGGGTGKVLQYLPSDVEVDYIELSSQMIWRAKSRRFCCKVNFHHRPFSHFNTDLQYDYILCPFFLDLFNDINLRATCEQIRKLLKEDSGQLIVTDFHVRYKTSFISHLMHLFFKWSTNMESEELKDIPSYIHQAGFHEIASKDFMNGKLFSKKYSLHGNH